jgi:hypothetical protein
MNRNSALILLIVVCLAGVLFSRVAGQSGTGFIINNADAQAVYNAQPSVDLNTLIRNVINHFIIDRADANSVFSIGVPPPSLQVGIHFVLDQADNNKVLGSKYPAQLINDQTPPQITKITSKGTSGGVMLVIETNEFTTLEINYGTSAGNHSNVLTDPLLLLQHEITLPPLAGGQAYYVIVKAMDRSGNLTTAPEEKITGSSSIYLPAIKR